MYIKIFNKHIFSSKIIFVKKIQIDLHHFDDLIDFMKTVRSFDSDINIIKGSIVYDAKSILAVISLSRTENLFVEIITYNTSEELRFCEEMKRFRKE